jgi:hypothetical protein
MQLISQEISEQSIDSRNIFPVKFKEIKACNTKRSYRNSIHQRRQDVLQVGAHYLHVK